MVKGHHTDLLVMRQLKERLFWDKDCLMRIIFLVNPSSGHQDAEFEGLGHERN